MYVSFDFQVSLIQICTSIKFTLFLVWQWLYFDFLNYIHVKKL